MRSRTPVNIAYERESHTSNHFNKILQICNLPLTGTELQRCNARTQVKPLTPVRDVHLFYVYHAHITIFASPVVRKVCVTYLLIRNKTLNSMNREIQAYCSSQVNHQSYI